MVRTPMNVAEYCDSIAYVDTEAEANPRFGVLLPRDKWRVIGPSTWTPVDRCKSCGSTHEIDGHPIYTIGCHPAALPVGMANDFATYPVTDDAHPVALWAIPNCPSGDARLMPHNHTDSEYQWVD